MVGSIFWSCEHVAKHFLKSQYIFCSVPIIILTQQYQEYYTLGCASAVDNVWQVCVWVTTICHEDDL